MKMYALVTLCINLRWSTAPKKSSKIHRYRANNQLRKNWFIFFRSIYKKNSEICLQSKINYHYWIGGANRCITLNRRRLLCIHTTQYKLYDIKVLWNLSTIFMCRLTCSYEMKSNETCQDVLGIIHSFIQSFPVKSDVINLQYSLFIKLYHSQGKGRKPVPLMFTLY